MTDDLKKAISFEAKSEEALIAAALDLDQSPEGRIMARMLREVGVPFFRWLDAERGRLRNHDEAADLISAVISFATTMMFSMVPPGVDENGARQFTRLALEHSKENFERFVVERARLMREAKR